MKPNVSRRVYIDGMGNCRKAGAVQLGRVTWARLNR
jgi:hypothetical protein